jgi:glyoxylase-like metal-dependent hydrolase (beta-lactamase superfamily II)
MTELGLIKPKPQKGGIVKTYTQGAMGGHANVYWFDTNAGPVVVDVPLTLSDSKKLRSSLVRPYRIYITEADPARFGGLSIMKSPDVPVYTTPAIATEIQTHGDRRLGPFHRRYGEDVASHVDTPAPSIEERAQDVIGDLPVEFIPLGPAAAESSLAVYLPKTGELIAGDVVAGKEHLDVSWGRSKVWLDRIAELKALEPKFVYPGHGGDGGPELLDETLEYLTFFHETVASRVKQGAPAKISKADAAYVKRTMLAKYPKLGRPELLDRSIPGEYAVQLAELAPSPGSPAGGAPAAASASSTTKSTSTTTSDTSNASSDDMLSTAPPPESSSKKKHKK